MTVISIEFNAGEISVMYGIVKWSIDELSKESTLPKESKLDTQTLRQILEKLNRGFKTLITKDLTE